MLAVGIDLIPVVFTATSVDIHLSESQPALALPDVASSPEHEDDGKGEVGVEPILGSTKVRTNRRDSNVELQVLSVTCI